MEATKNQIIHTVTENYLSNLDPSKTDKEIEAELIEAVKYEYELHNSVADKGQKWRYSEYLEEYQIAKILEKKYIIKKIAFTEDSNREYMVLGMYDEEEGIYITDINRIRAAARSFKCNLTIKEFKEIEQILNDEVEAVECCNNEDLVACKNCIFDYKNQKEIPFSPEYIFTSKIDTDFNSSSKNVVLINPDDNTTWDVESWINELVDSPEMEEALWKVIGAAVRPHVRWNKMIMFYSRKGNNGKGSVVRLIRNIVGKSNYAPLSINDFAREFMLEPLITTSCVISDENKVDCYLDDIANLKACITNDVIMINRKNRTPIKYQFRGVQIHCVNSILKHKDTTESAFRRWLYYPFDKCFTGRERRYIKEDYLNRKDVREYVLYKVLTQIPLYYELDEPQECKDILSKAKATNNPVLDFWNDVEDRFTWRFLPSAFLFDVFKGYYYKTHNRALIMSLNTFKEELFSIIDNSKWEHRAKGNLSPQKISEYLLDQSEMLINEFCTTQYCTTAWMNDTYTGFDLRQKCVFSKWKSQYRDVLIRK